MNRIAITTLALLAVSCGREAISTAQTEEIPVSSTTTAAPAPAPGTNHDLETVDAWKARRLKSLQSEDGWLTLVGLHWLQEGENTFGSGRTNAHVLPASAPELAGTLTLDGGKVTLTPSAPMTIVSENGAGTSVSGPTVLADDNAEDGPTVVQMGTMRFQVIKRGDRFGLRVKDSASPVRTQFAGLDYFPVNPKWRVEARFEPYDPPKQIPMADVTGMIQPSISPGALVFTVDGREYRLDPILEDGSPNLFIVFRDETSADATYPAGRYVYASPAGADGKVILDFNKAYNPPCAFTDFATCPLPPPQNRLPVRIEAGEKKYAGAH